MSDVQWDIAVLKVKNDLLFKTANPNYKKEKDIMIAIN